VSSITVDLPEEKLLILQEIASRYGISVEELARLSIDELLSAPDGKFERAAQYVLKKNEELYRHLA
jgi:hypothetical protein